MVSEGRGSQLLIGTTRNCILNGTPQLGFQPIILGHTDELWGLASHPAVPQFATAGFDKVLQMWDSMSHSILWSKDIGVNIKKTSPNSVKLTLFSFRNKRNALPFRRTVNASLSAVLLGSG